MSTTEPYRLAYLVSHPIQYQAPLLRSIAQSPEIDLTTFFLSDFSLRGYRDAGFGTTVHWDVPLIDGYKSVFLPAIGGTERVTPLRPWTIGLHHHLSNGKFDALWLHGYAHQANLRAMMIAKRLGIKVFLRTDTNATSALGSGVKRKIKEAALRRIFATADGFFAVGSLNRDYYLKYGASPDKIFVMPYAVDNAFFQNAVDAARQHHDRLRAELGLEAGRPVILCASRFIARKRIGDLIDAYAALSEDGRSEPRPYLLLVGDGDQKTILEAKAEKLGWSSIKFLGFKNQTELPAFYELCDVFVLVSEQEPWALIVNEIMNAGKPLILSDQVGAAPDLVQNGENGYVVQTGDISALTERLRQILSNPDEAARMGANSRKLIDRWGLPENVAVLERALRATVSNDTSHGEPLSLANGRQ